MSVVTTSRGLMDLVAKGLLTLEGRICDRVYRPVPVEQVRAGSTAR